jgi:hypothetical protein
MVSGLSKLPFQGVLTSYAEGFGLDIGSDGSYPFTYAEGLDFAKNLAIDTIDFGTFHLYPSTCMYNCSHIVPCFGLGQY